MKINFSFHCIPVPYRNNQCFRSGMFISDPRWGDPDLFSIPDQRSPISDPGFNNNRKEEGGGKFVIFLFFVSINFTKLWVIFIFKMKQVPLPYRKIVSKFNLELKYFYPKNWYWSLRNISWVPGIGDPRSGKNLNWIPNPVSAVKKASDPGYGSTTLVIMIL